MVVGLNFTTESEVVIGEEAVVECRVTGDPTPAVTWSKDGVDVVNGSGIVIRDPQLLGNGSVLSVLSIVATDIEDDGVYACNATNHVGSDSLSIELNLLGELAHKTVS